MSLRGVLGAVGPLAHRHLLTTANTTDVGTGQQYQTIPTTAAVVGGELLRCRRGVLLWGLLMGPLRAMPLPAHPCTFNTPAQPRWAG